MKLIVLTVEPEAYETKRLVTEAMKKSYAVAVKIPESLDLRTPLNCEVLLVRSIKGQTKAAKLIAEKAHQHGVVVVDEKIALGKARSKYQNCVAFKQAGLYVPETVLLNDSNLDQVQNFNCEEVVVKEASGKRGMFIYKVKKDQIREIYGKLKVQGRPFMAQAFVSINKEYRVLFVGDKCLGGFEKISKDWIKNISKGAEAVAHSLTPEIVETAKRAKDVVRTEIAGVDIGETENGLFVIEVNRAPGFRGFEQATKKNVAAEIIRYCEEKLAKKKKRR